MAVIDEILGPSSFELIRDRTAAILADELGNQAVLQAQAVTPDQDLIEQLTRLKIVTERFRPFNESDYPALDVFLFQDEFDNKSQQSVRGTIQLYLDLYTDGERKAIDRESDAGDQLSAKRAQRIVGLIRTILEHPAYNTLDFDVTAGEVIIQRTLVSAVKRTEEENTRDGLNVMMYRVIFEVVASETTNALDGLPLALATTDVKIDETDLGYQYIFDPNG